MKSVPRFPFIISFHQKEHSGVTEQDNSILQLLKKLITHCDNNEVKTALLLKKMVILESDLEELLEQNQEKYVESRQMEEFFTELILVTDSMEIAVKSGEETGNIQLARGLKLINNKIIKQLIKMDVRKTAELEKEFNPRYHEAVGTSVSTMDSGFITEIIENGWIFRDKILRFAKVIVEK